MDKNSARGRACKIVSFVLNGSIKEGVVDTVLNKQLSPEDAALVKQEMQAIADECEEQAEFHRNVERGVKTSQMNTNSAGDEVGMHSVGEHYDSISLYTRGKGTYFTMSTPEDAKKLYDALMRVKEIEAD